jgi:hypothetical protein
MPDGTFSGGFIRGTTTDLNGDGASVSTFSGSALYTALLDSTPWQTIYPDPTVFNAGANASASILEQTFGSPIPSLPGPPVATTIGIQIDFLLTPFDRVRFETGLDVVPEPGTGLLVIVGLLGFAGWRRVRA